MSSMCPGRSGAKSKGWLMAVNFFTESAEGKRGERSSRDNKFGTLRGKSYGTPSQSESIVFGFIPTKIIHPIY